MRLSPRSAPAPFAPFAPLATVLALAPLTLLVPFIAFIASGCTPDATPPPLPPPPPTAAEPLASSVPKAAPLDPGIDGGLGVALDAGPLPSTVMPSRTRWTRRIATRKTRRSTQDGTPRRCSLSSVSPPG